MAVLERAVIEETGDTGYFKDIVARQDINEIKKIVEEVSDEVSDMQELTDKEATAIYNRVYKEIFG